MLEQHSEYSRIRARESEDGTGKGEVIMSLADAYLDISNELSKRLNK